MHRNTHHIIVIISDTFLLGNAHKRLDTFILSVGDSPDKTKHRQCASHNGRVAAGGTVEEQCKGIGRYLSFRRDGGHESYVTGLCEVVVIGHRHIGK